MAVNYSKPLPQDRNMVPMVNSLPPYQSLQVNVRENGAASSAWGLNSNTTAVLVTPIGGGAAIKWGTNQETSVFASIGGMAYDATLAAGESRLFAVPRNTAGIPNWNNVGAPSLVGLNTSEGLFSVIATRSLGVGSVLLTEY